MVVVSIFMQQKYFFALNSSGCSHVGSLFTGEEQKRLAGDVTHEGATYARRVHDITNLVKMAALRAVFQKLSNVNFQQTRPQIKRETAVIYFSFRSY